VTNFLEISPNRLSLEISSLTTHGDDLRQITKHLNVLLSMLFGQAMTPSDSSGCLIRNPVPAKDV